MTRKRSFDIDEALEVSMRQFWLNGYEGTSITDLCNLIGIERPSLYRAFKSKGELFCLALELYQQKYLQFVSHALAAPTAYDVARLLLEGHIRTVTLPRMPRGAFDLNAGIISSPECETIGDKLAEYHSEYQKTLSERFARAKQNGDLKDEIHPQALARYLMAICAGIALQAKIGASRAALQEIAEIALAAMESATSFRTTSAVNGQPEGSI